MGKPEIAFISEHCCVRVVKEASVLKQLGYKVHLFSSHPNSISNFDTIHYWNSPYTLERLVELTKSVINIWQIHNEPTWMVSVVRNAAGDSAKVVLDYHDSNYWMMDPKETLAMLKSEASWFHEDIAVQVADAFIVPSLPCKDELSTRTSKPIAFVPCAAPLSEYRYNDVTFVGGLALQGGHAISGTPVRTPNGERWRDYIELYNSLKGKKQVYAYSPSFLTDPGDPVYRAYAATGAKLSGMNYDQLLNAIGSHEWNMVGNVHKAKVLDYSLPNKFFDSVAAGIPSIVMNYTEVAKIVKDMDIGIVVDSVDELLARWGEHKDKRVNLHRRRKELCMENFIQPQCDLYEELMS